MIKLNIFIADNHMIVREAIKLILQTTQDMEVVGEAGDGKIAAQLVLQLQPDVVTMDVSMPKLNGLMATRQIKETLPKTKILALSRLDDCTCIHQMMEAGADAYVHKQSGAEEMVRAIRSIMAGNKYIDPAVTAKTVSFGHDRANKPTWRESETLRMIVLGYGHKEIAAQLGVSIKTIEIQKANAMKKLNFVSRVDIVKYAALVGWLDET